MSMRLDGWRLGLTVIGLILSVLTLACSLAFSLGILDGKVNMITERLTRIEQSIDSGGICRSCTSFFSK